MINDNYFENELPKRNDNIYKEIEAFEDYELTQCIVYEMAFRSPKNKERIDDIIDYYYKHKTEIDNTIYKKTQNGRNTIFDFGTYPLYQLYVQVSMIDFIDGNYKEKRFSPIFLEILKKVDYFKKNQEEFEKIKIDEEEKYIEATKISQHIGYKIETSFINIIREELGTDKKYTFDDVKIMLLERHAGFGAHPEGQRKVIETFNRPKLCLYPLDTKDTLLEVNLNKPLDEIIAYITHVKNDMEKNDLLKAPIELLGIELEKTDTKISKKKLADKFFVYDYVKERLKQIDELNKEVIESFENKLKDIKDNKYLSGTDKKIQIVVLKEEHKENLIDTKIDDIFGEEALCSFISPGTAKRYYYDLKTYIDDEKYKELITGVTI